MEWPLSLRRVCLFNENFLVGNFYYTAWEEEKMMTPLSRRTYRIFDFSWVY